MPSLHRLLQRFASLLRRSITLAALLPAISCAQAYRWVDTDGKTHFSDQPPVQQNTPYHTIKGIGVENNLPGASAERNAAVAGELAGTGLVVARVDLPWPGAAEQKTSLGRYFFGKACASATAMVLPDALHQHPELLPQPAFIGSEIAQHFRQHSISSYWEDSLDVSDAGQWPNALRLRVRLADLKLDSCAPSESRSFINFKLADIPVRNFRRHRISFTLHWQLLTTQGEEIIHSNTRADLDSWNQSLTAPQAFAQALQQASNQLLAQADFRNAVLQHKPTVATLTSDEDTPQTTPVWAPLQALQDKTSQYLSFYRQSQLSRVLAVVPAIKVKLTEFYMHEGFWPGDLSQIGMHEAGLVNNNAGLQRIYLEANGGILLKLDNKFGPDARLFLKPLTDTANQMIYWHCKTNIAPGIVPRAMNCKQESENS